MPQPRCSSKEVSIASARKEELKAQLAKAEQDRNNLLAEMEEQEDLEAAAEEAAAVRSLQDVARVEASPDEDGPVPSHSLDDTDDKTSGDTAKIGSTGEANEHISSKARTVIHHPLHALTAIHRERQAVESELISRQRRRSLLAFVNVGKLVRATPSSKGTSTNTTLCSHADPDCMLIGQK